MQNPIIAIAASDLHLSHNPPVARSNEKDWYGIMEGYLNQLAVLQKEYECPILIAGDFFHKSDNPAELINFLLRTMPDEIYGIPGQHDLSHHNYEDIKKTSYWTLVEAGKIKHLEPGKNTVRDFSVYGFPWGVPITPPDDNDKCRIRIAIAHTYVWWKDNKFQGAPKEKNIAKMSLRLEDYSTAVFGDNHKGFWLMPQLMNEAEDEPWIINCGAFIRRRMDEIHYQPQVGLIHAAGNITIHELDIQSDSFIDMEKALEVIEHAVEAADLLEELGKAGTKVIEFVQSVQEFCIKNNIGRGVRSILSEVMKED